jgi:hypothetical protein
MSRKNKRKPANKYRRIKAPRRPMTLDEKKYFAMKKCKVPSHILSASQPMKAEVRMHLEVEVPWELAVSIFGKNLQGHRRANDKRFKQPARAWVRSVLAAFKEGLDNRNRLDSLGIKQTNYYQRANPRGEHLLFVELPTPLSSLPTAKEFLSTLPLILSKSVIDYYIGRTRVPGRRLQSFDIGKERGALFPLIDASSKKGRVFRAVPVTDTAEVVAFYETFVRTRKLLGRSVKVTQEDLDSIAQGSVPERLKILPADATYQLKRLAHALMESADAVTASAKAAIGWR